MHEISTDYEIAHFTKRGSAAHIFELPINSHSTLTSLSRPSVTAAVSHSNVAVCCYPYLKTATVSEPWLPDGDSQILRLYVFGPSGLKDYGSATLRCKI